MTDTYFASIGELFLISSLVYLSLQVQRLTRETEVKVAGRMILLGAFSIIIASSIGIFRFAGFEQFVYAHDTASYWAKHLGMVLYAAGFSWVLLEGKYQTFIKTVALAGFLSAAVLPEFVADVSLFLLLAFTAYKSQFTKPIILALVLLLCVPLTVLLPLNVDAQMGIFHLLLAAHFVVHSRVILNKQFVTKNIAA